MWIAKRPDCLAAARGRVWRWLQTSTGGGSRDTLVNEFAAMPQWTSPAPAVTMVTPVGYAPITERKTAWSITAAWYYPSAGGAAAGRAARNAASSGSGAPAPRRRIATIWRRTAGAPTI